MPKLFVSHASSDHDIVQMFVSLLEDGLNFRREEIRCTSLPGYGFPIGTPFRDEIREDLKAASAVISITSPAFLSSPYCLSELGAAWGLERPLLPLALTTSRLSDVEGILSELNIRYLNEKGTLEALREQLEPLVGGPVDRIRWESRRDLFLRNLARERSGDRAWRWRGFWTEQVVDGTLYVAPDLPTVGLSQQVRRALEQERVLSPHLFYVTDQGFESWLALSDDDRYIAFQDSLALLRDKSEDIAQGISQATGGRNIDFISLGPGNGRKDLALLRALFQLNTEGARDLFYYPFDVSASMVAKAMTRVGGDATIRHRIGQVKAIVADFSALPIFKAVYQYRDGPNVLSFLGNTLGNFRDDYGMLESLHGSMFEGDMLLLEVRLRPSGEDPIASLGDVSINKRFDFGPLELLGVPFDEEKLTYRVVPERGTIRGSQTTVAEYAEVRLDSRVFKRVQLSYVHGYERKPLLDHVDRAGLRVVQEWTSPQKQNLMLLLKKPAKK